MPKRSRRRRDKKQQSSNQTNAHNPSSQQRQPHGNAAFVRQKLSGSLKKQPVFSQWYTRMKDNMSAFLDQENESSYMEGDDSIMEQVDDDMEDLEDILEELEDELEELEEMDPDIRTKRGKRRGQNCCTVEGCGRQT